MINNVLTEMQKGVLKWYDFKEKANALCVEGNDSLVQMLWDQGIQVVDITVRQSARKDFIESHMDFFDYIIVIGALETCFEPVKMLKRWRTMLKADGQFFIRKIILRVN